MTDSELTGTRSDLVELTSAQAPIAVRAGAYSFLVGLISSFPAWFLLGLTYTGWFKSFTGLVIILMALMTYGYRAAIGVKFYNKVVRRTDLKKVTVIIAVTLFIIGHFCGLGVLSTAYATG